MPTKVRVYLAAAAAIVTAVSLLLGSPVGASTAACGSACTSPSVQSQGTGEVLAVSGSSSIVMAAANTTSSTQDWAPEFEGTVGNAASYGIVSPRLNWQYLQDQLVEFQYAPAGVPSDQCLSDIPAEQSYYPPSLTVALAQCGVTAQSLWIVDANNEANGYVDLINAGYMASSFYPVPSSMTENTTLDLHTLFAEPAVLTVNGSGKVVLAPLSEIGGVVSTSQMWADWSAPAQGAMRAAVARSRLKMDRFR